MPELTSKLVYGLAFGTPKFYIAPYGRIKYELFNLSCNCDVKSGLRDLATKLDVHGQHCMLSYFSSLPISVLCNLDTEANKFLR